jgi:hypothetical protein
MGKKHQPLILYWSMMITTDHHHIWVGTQLDDRTMASPGSTHQFSSLALPEQMKPNISEKSRKT